MAKSTLTLAPIHAARIGAGELRFYAPLSPVDNQPWHSQDDLLLCMGLPRPLRRRFQAMNREPMFAGQWQEAKTPNGAAVIATHGMAQGLMGAVARTGQLPEGFQRAYGLALAAALALGAEG